MKEENIKVVEASLYALKEKDLSRAAFAEDLEFADPIAGRGRGGENFKAFLSGFLPAIEDIRIISHTAEGEFIVTHWEADGVFGIIQVLEKFRVREGVITEAYAFYDPRPVLG